MMIRRCLMGWLAMLLCAVAEPTVCRKCGWERDSASPRCANPSCEEQAVVSASAERLHPETTFSRTPALPSPASMDGYVRAELALSRKSLQAGHYESAWLYARNAAALNTLSTARGNPHAATIMKALELSLQSAPVCVSCGVCDGRGQIKTTRLLLSGPSAPRLSKCVTCGGQGKVRRALTADEQRGARGEAMKHFAEQQAVRRYQRMGEAWLPTALAEKLAFEQNVSVRRAIAPLCATCMGFGHEDCRKCNGHACIECRGRGCENGWVTTEHEREMVKGSRVLRAKCRACGGQGKASCEACSGRGKVACRRCNGSGTPARCRRCDGEGLNPCTRCVDGKRRGDTCTSCAGQGKSLCSGCNGAGYSKR